MAATGNQQNNSWGPRSCEVDAKQFTKCLDENQGNMQICGWYLEQLVSFLATAWNCRRRANEGVLNRRLARAPPHNTRSKDTKARKTP